MKFDLEASTPARAGASTFQGVVKHHPLESGLRGYRGADQAGQTAHALGGDAHLGGDPLGAVGALAGGHLVLQNAHGDALLVGQPAATHRAAVDPADPLQLGQEPPGLHLHGLRRIGQAQATVGGFQAVQGRGLGHQLLDGRLQG